MLYTIWQVGNESFSFIWGIDIARCLTANKIAYTGRLICKILFLWNYSMHSICHEDTGNQRAHGGVNKPQLKKIILTRQVPQA